ncbi:OmpH family outer membrane protein [Thalassospira lucentensis]|uniref:OmpH family outer membrane protein n=1 Tax=Thalassospira lucentensis TaxID=168935 RepID=A0A358HU70_9PROT|nr:OmpH family outer membrane protein [Thalassospira lucentensis]RCK26272.1 membrane protein [Thalassospira lucentensis MCCC 1A00383 = DSM 14000]HBU98719.1 OmpH family outer membrane protein [Thalassospira lucentensis]HCW66538.1 OmpH family outer membrane protein [Thalassospira lucentensis]
MSIMKSIRNVAFAVAVISGIGLSTEVRAQDALSTETLANVMIVDIDGILRESSAMRDVNKQLKERQQAYQQEIETRQQALREEDKQMAQQRTLLANDVFQEKQKAFQQKVADFQKFAQGRNRVLDEARAVANGTFQKKLIEIVAALAEERKSTLVLRKSEVILHAKGMNASAEILNRMNAQLPTIQVEFKEGS